MSDRTRMRWARSPVRRGAPAGTGRAPAGQREAPRPRMDRPRELAAEFIDLHSGELGPALPPPWPARRPERRAGPHSRRRGGWQW